MVGIPYIWTPASCVLISPPPPFSAVFEMRDPASFRLHNFSLVRRHLLFFLLLWKTKRPLLGYHIRSLAPNVMWAAWYELGRTWYPSIWNSGLFCLPKNKKLVFFIGFFSFGFLFLGEQNDCSSDGRIPYLYHTLRLSFISLSMRLTDHVYTRVETGSNSLISASVSPSNSGRHKTCSCRHEVSRRDVPRGTTFPNVVFLLALRSTRSNASLLPYTA